MASTAPASLAPAPLSSSPVSLAPTALASRLAPTQLATAQTDANTMTAASASAPVGLVSCKDGSDNAVVFANDKSIEYGVTFENMRSHFEMRLGSLFTDPYVNVWVYAEPVLELTANVSTTVHCQITKMPSIGPIPLVAGATLKLTTYLDFDFNAAASLNIQQRFYRMVGFESTPSGDIKPLSEWLPRSGPIHRQRHDNRHHQRRGESGDWRARPGRRLFEGRAETHRDRHRDRIYQRSVRAVPVPRG